MSLFEIGGVKVQLSPEGREAPPAGAIIKLSLPAVFVTKTG